MMRLIDADELMRSHCVECTYYNSGECLGANCDWDSIGHIREAKTVDAVPVVRCKDCKHFEKDQWGKAGDLPLIIAHCICTKWGDGCCTDENGYCFLGEEKGD